MQLSARCLARILIKTETEEHFVEQVRPSDEKVGGSYASRPIYFGWVIVAVCFLVMTLLAPLLASFSIFYVAILDDFRWSRADTALALSVYFSVSGLASPF